MGGEHERGYSPSRKGGSGDLPRENFDIMVASICVFNAFWMRFGPIISAVLAKIF